MVPPSPSKSDERKKHTTNGGVTFILTNLAVYSSSGKIRACEFSLDKCTCTKPVKEVHTYTHIHIHTQAHTYMLNVNQINDEQWR